MESIINAMRVLAELSEQAGKELDSLVDQSGYEDTMVITARMAARETFCYLGEMLGMAADRLEAKSNPEVKYGCHCELEEGMHPDGCVIDDGRPQDCFYAQTKYKRKEDCEHWQPIKIIG